MLGQLSLLLHTLLFSVTTVDDVLKQFCSALFWCAAGAVYSRYGKAEVGSPLMEHSQEELAECEGLVVRVRGDGQVYCIVLTTGASTLSQHFALHLHACLLLQVKLLE